MTLKTYKTAVRASTLLAAIALSGGAFATGGISESFEGKTGTLATSAIEGLTGNGTYASSVGIVAPTMGYPITNATHVTALEIAGTVTYTESGTPSSGASQVDFMFKVEPTDELEDPTGGDIKVALAVGTNTANTTTAPIKLWCKPTSSGAAQWVDLSGAVETGSWMRATLVLDYSEHKCSVSLNGNPALNGSSKWFYFANNDDSTYVSSITMVGSTMVDDLVVTHTALNSYEIPGGDTAVPGVPAGSPVKYADLNKYGISVEDAVEDNDVSGCGAGKISEKLTAGLNPKSPTKFEMQTMTSTSATAATITFPGNNGASGYTVTVTADAAGTGAVLDTATVTPGAANESDETINSATFSNLPDSNLIYFHLKTN